MLAMLAAAAPAANAFGITNFSAQPVSKAAGANSDLTVSFGVSDSAAGLKDLTVHLPPGLIGNPLATPTCSEAKLKADNCPARSDVGDAVNNVIVKPLGLLPIPLTVNGQVYNVEPRNGEPARFGIVLDPSPVPGLGAALPKIVLQQTARLRPGDFGLDTSLNDIPRSAKVAGVSTPLEVTGVSLTLKGKINGKGFLRNPTSCGVQPISIDADAYNNATAIGPGPVHDDELQRAPVLAEVQREHQANELGSPRPGPAVDDDLADHRGGRPEEGRGDAAEGGDRKRPGPGGPVLDRRFRRRQLLRRHDGRRCRGRLSPAGRAARRATSIWSTSGSGPFPDLGVDLKGGLALKVKGSLSAIPVDGGGLQIVVTFDGLPDIPLSEFTLTFADGPDGLNLVSA